MSRLGNALGIYRSSLACFIRGSDKMQAHNNNRSICECRCPCHFHSVQNNGKIGQPGKGGDGDVSHLNGMSWAEGAVRHTVPSPAKSPNRNNPFRKNDDSHPEPITATECFSKSLLHVKNMVKTMTARFESMAEGGEGIQNVGSSSDQCLECKSTHKWNTGSGPDATEIERSLGIDDRKVFKRGAPLEQRTYSLEPLRFNEDLPHPSRKTSEPLRAVQRASSPSIKSEHNEIDTNKKEESASKPPPPPLPPNTPPRRDSYELKKASEMKTIQPSPPDTERQNVLKESFKTRNTVELRTTSLEPLPLNKNLPPPPPRKTSEPLRPIRYSPTPSSKSNHDENNLNEKSGTEGVPPPPPPPKTPPRKVSYESTEIKSVQLSPCEASKLKDLEESFKKRANLEHRSYSLEPLRPNENVPLPPRKVSEPISSSPTYHPPTPPSKPNQNNEIVTNEKGGIDDAPPSPPSTPKTPPRKDSYEFQKATEIEKAQLPLDTDGQKALKEASEVTTSKAELTFHPTNPFIVDIQQQETVTNDGTFNNESIEDDQSSYLALISLPNSSIETRTNQAHSTGSQQHHSTDDQGGNKGSISLEIDSFPPIRTTVPLDHGATVLIRLSEEYDNLVMHPSTVQMETVARSVSQSNMATSNAIRKKRTKVEAVIQSGGRSCHCPNHNHSRNHNTATANVVMAMNCQTKQFHICHKCKKIVSKDEGKFHFIEDHYVAWHPHCFQCSDSECRKELRDGDFNFFDQEPYCTQHFLKEANIPKCSKCGELIFDPSYTSAGGKTWHKEHFNCHSCKKTLADTKFVLARKRHPYCLSCHERDFSKNCKACTRRIFVHEPYIQTGEFYWHSSESCLRCSACNGSLIGRPFLFRRDSQLYCNRYCGVRET